MTSAIYFNHETRQQGGSRLWSRRLLNLSLRVALKLTPDLSTRLTRKLLSRPARSSRRGSLSDAFERRHLKSDNGLIQIYSCGEGPVVLFTHGWSGNAFQFKSLMNEVSQQGYKAVAFDQYRHGSSGGTDSNYLLFISATKAVQEYLDRQGDPVKAVVGHSVGGMASLHALSGCGIPHFLLSPVIGVYSLFRECVLSAGMPLSMADGIARSFDTGYSMSFASTDEAACLTKTTAPVKLLHSTRDRVVPAARSLNLLQTHPSLDLNVGPYGGHTSILSKHNTKTQVCSWLCDQLS